MRSHVVQAGLVYRAKDGLELSILPSYPKYWASRRGLSSTLGSAAALENVSPIVFRFFSASSFCSYPILSNPQT